MKVRGDVTEEKIAIAKTAPSILGATLYGLTLQDWVAIVTIAYVILQAGLLVPKYWRMIRGWQKGDKQ
jgi:Phage holin T7 family, holin superfamily II